MRESDSPANQPESVEIEASKPGPQVSAQPPLWRHQPYRILFPLGAAIACAGVGHWWLHSMQVLPDYRPVFHAIAQIQGFLICFAVGFLFTAIPRRTLTRPPAAWEMAVAILAPVGTVVCAWFHRFAISQVFWYLLILMLCAFVARRFAGAGAKRRPPAGFLWIPLSFLMGLAGSLLIGIGGMRMDELFELHELGRLFLLQGMFVGLTIGVGSLFFPLVTRGENSKDLSARDLPLVAGHILAVGTLAASFIVENFFSLRGGLAMRAAIVAIMLVGSGKIHRAPTVPGLHRKILWVAAWMLPVGYLLAALFPAQKTGALHVVFIGGFALLALAVGMHVTLAHGGRQDLVRSWSWQVPVFSGLLLIAMVFRAMVDADPDRFFFWLKWSAGLFLLGLAAWATLVLPAAWKRPKRP